MIRETTRPGHPRLYPSVCSLSMEAQGWDSAECSSVALGCERRRLLPQSLRSRVSFSFRSLAPLFPALALPTPATPSLLRPPPLLFLMLFGAASLIYIAAAYCRRAWSRVWNLGGTHCWSVRLRLHLPRQSRRKPKPLRGAAVPRLASLAILTLSFDGASGQCLPVFVDIPTSAYSGVNDIPNDCARITGGSPGLCSEIGQQAFENSNLATLIVGYKVLPALSFRPAIFENLDVVVKMECSIAGCGSGAGAGTSCSGDGNTNDCGCKVRPLTLDPSWNYGVKSVSFESCCNGACGPGNGTDPQLPSPSPSPPPPSPSPPPPSPPSPSPPPPSPSPPPPNPPACADKPEEKCKTKKCKSYNSEKQQNCKKTCGLCETLPPSAPPSPLLPETNCRALSDDKACKIKIKKCEKKPPKSMKKCKKKCKKHGKKKQPLCQKTCCKLSFPV